MHLKTELSLKNSFLTAYLKLKQRLFKNFMSAPKTRVLKNLTLFALVDNNNNFNYNSKTVSKKPVLLLKNINTGFVISISCFVLTPSVYLRSRG